MKDKKPLKVESVEWQPNERCCYFVCTVGNGNGGRVFIMLCDIGDAEIVEVGLDPSTHPTRETIAAAWIRHQWDTIRPVGLDAGLKLLQVPHISPHIPRND